MKADPFKQSGLTSRIWASLPDEAEQQGKHVLWLHKFVATSEVANKKAARSMLAQINATSAYSTHVLLDDFVYVRNVLQGARALGKVARRPGLLKLAAHFPATSDVPDLTDLLSDQAMDSAARLLESQAAYKTWFSGVSRGHRADAVILLSEGQAWEYLVPSLAESMHARRLYYFVNATVGFWGLRFMNGRLAAKQSRFDTLLLVSRHQTLSELKSLGTSLADSRVVAGPSRALRRGSKMAPSSGREAQSQEQAVIALFADYDPESAALLADMVFSLPDKLRSRYRWVLQPHPANPLKPAIPYELEDLELWTRDSAALLGECEVVLTTYGTSMTLTSLEYGKPTAVVGDTDRLPQVLALDSLAPWIVLGADDLSAFLGAVEDGTYAPVRLQTPVNEASEVTWQSILREMAT